MAWGEVWRIAKATAAIFVAIVGIPASYVALRDADIAWQFFLAIPAALLLAVAVLYASKGRDWLDRVKKYPALLSQVAVLREEALEDRRTIKQLEIAVNAARSGGVEEGRDQLMGAINAASGAVPVARAVVNFRDSVAFLCRPSDELPTPGARYFVKMRNSGRIMGVVKVVLEDPDAEEFYLVCVDSRVSNYWNVLAERVDYDDTLPEAFELAAFTIDAAAVSDTREPDASDDSETIEEAEDL